MEISELKQVFTEKDAIVRRKEKEISDTDQRLNSCMQRCDTLQTQLEKAEGRIQSLEVSDFH